MLTSCKKYILFGSMVYLFAWCLSVQAEIPSYVDYVNPLVGTDSEFQLSTGNTYPAIAVPWGLNFWTPQTNGMGDGWGYQYDRYKLRGFKQTHQPSPWINDYAAFSFMPVVGKFKRAS